MAKTSSVNNQTASSPKSWDKGMTSKQDSATESKMAKDSKLPFPETWTVTQGSQNKDMSGVKAPRREKTNDFLSKDFSSENKNPNNESYPGAMIQPEGANPKGLGIIGKLANSDKWGNTGNS